MKPEKHVKIAMLALLAGLSVMPVNTAYAATDHELNFTFGGRGRNPGVTRMHDYILGCLPNRTLIQNGNPADATGPWMVEVPAIRGRDYSNADVQRTLMGPACAGVRPAKVVGVTVTDPDSDSDDSDTSD